MGFSPVTAGSAITAHTHTNAAGDGGALNTSTLYAGDSRLLTWLVIN